MVGDVSPAGTCQYYELNTKIHVKSNKVIRSYVFVCVEVLQPSQPYGAMSSKVSLPNHTFIG